VHLKEMKMIDFLVVVGSKLHFVRDLLLGLSGGAVSYIFDYSKAKRSGDIEFKFRLSSLFVNMTLGAFVGYSMGNLLENDMHGRDALVAFSGVAAFNILLIAESRLAGIIFDLVDKYLGKKKD